jgi:hypothetical protein
MFGGRSCTMALQPLTPQPESELEPDDPYSYVIFLADLHVSRQVQKEFVTPFKTEYRVSMYLLDSWMMGLLPLEILGDYLKEFHTDIYTKHVPDDMRIDWSTLNSEHKQEIHSEIEESLKDDTNLRWFIDELPKASRWPYLCYKRGAGTHTHIMMEMLRRGGLIF